MGAVAQAVSVAGVAVGVSALGRVVQAPSSGVTSLRDFGVSRDLSLEDLSRLKQHGLRDPQSQGLGRLEINHELELRQLPDGQVGRLRAFENLDVISTLASCPA